MKLTLVLIVSLIAVCLHGAVISRGLKPRTEADFDDYLDSLLDGIRTYASEMGLDPLPLPDYTETLSIDLLLVNFQGEVDLKDGILQDIVTVSRQGDAIIDYEDMGATITFDLGFDELRDRTSYVDELRIGHAIIDELRIGQYQYNFEASIMGIGPSGLAHGTITDLSVHVVIDADLTNITHVDLELEDLKIIHTGSISVLLEGPLELLDIVADGISAVITTLFKDEIMIVIESEVRRVVEEVIAKLDFGVGGSTVATS
uniref:Uncharacterized protein n=1 Tax=Timema tahoe TaxID=61484 RepID=A0A7R9II68_9NEOP|nr:unnamed protein product [Timema tahoe]